MVTNYQPPRSPEWAGEGEILWKNDPFVVTLYMNRTHLWKIVNGTYYLIGSLIGNEKTYLKKYPNPMIWVEQILGKDKSKLLTMRFHIKEIENQMDQIKYVWGDSIL